MKNYKLILLLSFLLFSISAKAESGLTESFHESGKINVVIAVISIIFLGLLFYLVRLDRKVRKMEEQIKDQE